MDNYGERIDAHTVRFERLLPGPVEKIWAYLTDGQKRGEWFASGPLPSKVGDSFEFHFKHSDLSPNKSLAPERFQEMDAKGFHAKERLLALEPMRRLVHTFGEDTPPPSEVERGQLLRALASDAAAFMTGATLDISGGRFLR